MLLFFDKNGVKTVGRHFSFHPNLITYGHRIKEKLIVMKKNTQNSFQTPITGKFPDINNGMTEYVRQLRDEFMLFPTKLYRTNLGEKVCSLNISDSQLMQVLVA